MFWEVTAIQEVPACVPSEHGTLFRNASQGTKGFMARAVIRFGAGKDLSQKELVTNTSVSRLQVHAQADSKVTRHVLTSDICGKRLMAKGRARPKAARHTRLWTGRIIRGRDLRSDVLERKGFIRPFHRPDHTDQVPLDLGSPTTELSLHGNLRLHLHRDLDGLHIDQLRDGLQLCKESEAGQKLLEKSWMMAGRNLHHFPNFIPHTPPVRHTIASDTPYLCDSYPHPVLGKKRVTKWDEGKQVKESIQQRAGTPQSQTNSTSSIWLTEHPDKPGEAGHGGYITPQLLLTSRNTKPGPNAVNGRATLLRALLRLRQHSALPPSLFYKRQEFLLFILLPGWRLNHFPGQPVPMLDNPFSEVKFPNIQSKPPLVQLQAISSRPMACYLGEETDPTSLQPPFRQLQRAMRSPLSLLFSRLNNPSLVLQTLPQPRCPSLDTLQPLKVSLVVGGPTLNPAFEVRPHQCPVQGHDHCPSPAGHTISDTSQDAIGLLGHLGTLLAHIQLAVDQHPQVLLCWAAFQPLFPTVAPQLDASMEENGVVLRKKQGCRRGMSRKRGD
ncbi:hypothetical protein QYF61_025591 [Mycteria americana]|uniref:Uncharacterized protein n=1 Tax=Mycteria americana TaxID=33587 RepID=A0AAN7RSV7_MYCAM|nr:hypothetical protein QYF61_025591 [Mycteria americana]